MTSIFARTLCILHITTIILFSCVEKKTRTFTVYENRDRITHNGQTTSRSRSRSVLYSLLLPHRDDRKSVDPREWGRCLIYDTLTKLLHRFKRRYKAPATDDAASVCRQVSRDGDNHPLSFVSLPRFIYFFGCIARDYRSWSKLVREFDAVFAVKTCTLDASTSAGFHTDRSTRRVVNSEYYMWFHVFRIYHCYLYTEPLLGSA